MYKVHFSRAAVSDCPLQPLTTGKSKALCVTALVVIRIHKVCLVLQKAHFWFYRYIYDIRVLCLSKHKHTEIFSSKDYESTIPLKNGFFKSFSGQSKVNCSI